MSVLILQVLLVLGLPALVLWASRHVSAIRVLSPVLVCYLLGMLWGNQPLLPVDGDLALMLSAGSVALAIPLLLFSTDFLGWVRLAPVTVLSFALVIVSVVVASVLGYFLFSDHLPEAASLCGMLVGVYIGGTPNMATIGTARGVAPELFVQLNAADLLATAIYLVAVFTVAQRFLGKFLPSYSVSGDSGEDAIVADSPRLSPLPIAIGIGLAALVVGAGFLVSRLFAEGMQEAAAILGITTFALLLSTRPRVRQLPGTSEAGVYFLLMFCIAVGSTANFTRLFESSWVLMLLVAFVIYVSVLIHILLGWLFKIDRDTLIVTSVAGITNPALIAPVAMALKNKHVVVSGIASGLVGYAVANYLGMLVAWILG